jgi:NAD(P)-dependent dehydrogenase (short-subunit alcohol dehydrogenase family)
VVVTDMNDATVRETAQLVRNEGGEAWSFVLDVTAPEACHALAERVASEIGNVDLLVNNAGIIIRENTSSPNAAANWKKTIDVNVHGTFNTTLAFIPVLKQTKGSIINIASIAAYAGQAASLGYAPSKGAIKMLTQSLAQELAPAGARVNALAPGVIETPMTAATRENPQRLESFMTRIPMGRVGQTEDLVGPVIFWPATCRATSPASCCRWTAASRGLKPASLLLSLPLPRQSTSGDKNENHPSVQDIAGHCSLRDIRRVHRHGVRAGHQGRLQRRPVRLAFGAERPGRGAGHGSGHCRHQRRRRRARQEAGAGHARRRVGPAQVDPDMSDLIDNEKVVAVFGPTNSGNAMAWKHIANQKKIPVLGNVGSGTDITKPMSPGADNYMFRVSMVDASRWPRSWPT